MFVRSSVLQNIGGYLITLLLLGILFSPGILSVYNHYKYKSQYQQIASFGRYTPIDYNQLSFASYSSTTVGSARLQKMITAVFEGKGQIISFHVLPVQHSDSPLVNIRVRVKATASMKSLLDILYELEAKKRHAISIDNLVIESQQTQRSQDEPMIKLNFVAQEFVKLK